MKLYAFIHFVPELNNKQVAYVITHDGEHEATEKFQQSYPDTKEFNCILMVGALAECADKEPILIRSNVAHAE